MTPSFTARLLFTRARQYTARHKPKVVAVVGSHSTLLYARAIALAAAKQYKVRYATKAYRRPADVASDILGIDHPQGTGEWFRLLVGSGIRELAEDPEPSLIIITINPQAPGEGRWLAQQLQPDIVVLANTDSYNLQRFSKLQYIAHEQLAVALPAARQGSTIVMNLDDPFIADMRHHLKATPLTYSTRHPATVRLARAERISPAQVSGLISAYHLASHEYELLFPHLVSRQQLAAPLAALAVAHALRLDIAKASDDLAALRPPGGYQDVKTTEAGATLIDSSRQHGPQYLLDVLPTWQKLTTPSRKIVILADMPGLAARSQKWHQVVGESYASSTDILVTIGRDSKWAQQAALFQGDIDTHHFENLTTARDWIRQLIKPTDLIFTAGAHMESP